MWRECEGKGREGMWGSEDRGRDAGRDAPLITTKPNTSEADAQNGLVGLGKAYI